MSNSNRVQNNSTYIRHAEHGSKVRSSITNKLSGKMFFRLLGLFMSFNLLIFLIAGAALIVYSERKVLKAIDLLPYAPVVSGAPDTGEWMELAGLNIQVISAPPPVSSSFKWPFTRYLSFEPDYVYRELQAQGGGFNDAIRSIDYVINVGYAGNVYEIRIDIGTFILYFIYAFFVLLAFELLTLITQTAEDRRLIRRTLHPISDLARTAQSLSEINRTLDPEKMKALPGFLNGIDAGRLDRRIQIDDLQDELKNVAVAVNEMLDRINESYAAQARFVSDASHELRTPIAVIQGYANLLDRWGAEDEKALRESISAIKDEAENMNDLVEQLLFLARGDSNRINMLIVNIDLSELVEEVITESRIIDERHEFNVVCEKITISADRGLIKQALRILIDNAIKYTDKGGDITVSAAADAGFARLSVSDSGIGIKPEILPNVFDRFVRADESRTRATGGAGLGLSIAQWITEKHNGYLEVLSREDIGTRITMVLPLETVQPEAGQPRAGQQQGSYTAPAEQNEDDLPELI